jgi:hypothetical protein
MSVDLCVDLKRVFGIIGLPCFSQHMRFLCQGLSVGRVRLPFAAITNAAGLRVRFPLMAVGVGNEGDYSCLQKTFAGDDFGHCGGSVVGTIQNSWGA